MALVDILVKWVRLKRGWEALKTGISLRNIMDFEF
jgi:hypothetical protein